MKLGSLVWASIKAPGSQADATDMLVSLFVIISQAKPSWEETTLHWSKYFGGKETLRSYSSQLPDWPSQYIAKYVRLSKYPLDISPGSFNEWNALLEGSCVKCVQAVSSENSGLIRVYPRNVSVCLLHFVVYFCFVYWLLFEGKGNVFAVVNFVLFGT